MVGYKRIVWDFGIVKPVKIEPIQMKGYDQRVETVKLVFRESWRQNIIL